MGVTITLDLLKPRSGFFLRIHWTFQLVIILFLLLWPYTFHGLAGQEELSSTTTTTPQADRTDFQQALPGFQFQFPRDHGTHDQFRTEWWYYTGHLTSSTGRPFGYQLTFFRRGVSPTLTPPNPSQWTIHNLYLAHFAVSDIRTSSFFVGEKLSRAALGKAGALPNHLHVWIDAWKAQALAKDSPEQQLYAATDSVSLNLTLSPQKDPVIHGQRGVSQKGDLRGQSSHYYSYSRLDTEGTLTIQEEEFTVSGSSWMDHEFGSADLPDNLAGWDWFSIQLDDGSELMYYLLRRKDGSDHAVSSGTYIPKNGSPLHLRKEDFHLVVDQHWVSPESGARYPNRWTIRVRPLNMTLALRPLMDNQELHTDQSTRVIYWEGAVAVTGNRNHTPLSGKGYVELTGYAKHFDQPL